MGAVLWVLMGARTPSTDLEFLEATLKEILAPVPWGELPDTVFLIRPGREAGWEWLVGECLTQEAKKAGKTVIVRSGNPAPAGLSLSYTVGDMRVIYTNKKGFLPWSPRKLLREARAQVYMTATDGDGVVIWNRTLSGERSEGIDPKTLEAIRVEGLSPEIKEKEGGGIAEPVITAVVLGGLLYIFYAFESQ